MMVIFILNKRLYSIFNLKKKSKIFKNASTKIKSLKNKTLNKVLNVRYKYVQIFDSLRYKQFIFDKNYIGHSLYEWNDLNGFYVLYITKESSAFSMSIIMLTFRKVLSFIVNYFEIRPYSKFFVINGLPNEDSLDSISITSNLMRRLSNIYYLRWLPGTFSNRCVIFEYWKYRYYERLKNQHLFTWRASTAEKIFKINFVPDLVIALSSYGIYNLMLREAESLKIPTIGIVDSNSSDFGVTYPIRGNDDSFRSLSLYIRILKKAIRLGRRLSFKFCNIFNRSLKSSIRNFFPAKLFKTTHKKFSKFKCTKRTETDNCIKLILKKDKFDIAFILKGVKRFIKNFFKKTEKKRGGDGKKYNLFFFFKLKKIYSKIFVLLFNFLKKLNRLKKQQKIYIKHKPKPKPKPKLTFKINRTVIDKSLKNKKEKKKISVYKMLTDFEYGRRGKTIEAKMLFAKFFSGENKRVCKIFYLSKLFKRFRGVKRKFNIRPFLDIIENDVRKQRAIYYSIKKRWGFGSYLLFSKNFLYNYYMDKGLKKNDK